MIIAVYMRSKKVKWLLLSRGLQLFDLGRKVRHFFRLLHYELLVNLNCSGGFALADENDGEAFGNELVLGVGAAHTQVGLGAWGGGQHGWPCKARLAAQEVVDEVK